MFRDVTTLYSNSEAMKEVIKLTCDYWRNEGLTSIAGIEAFYSKEKKVNYLMIL